MLLRLPRDTYFAGTEDHAEDVCIMKDFTISNLKNLFSSLVTGRKHLNSSKIHRTEAFVYFITSISCILL